MPTITEKPAVLHVFCGDPRCSQYPTREIEGIAREVSRTAFEEAGPGTINGSSVAWSSVQYLVPSGDVDEHGHAIGAELSCPDCSKPLHVSPTPRPDYAPVSGQHPMELLRRQVEQQNAITGLMATKPTDDVSSIDKLAEVIASLANREGAGEAGTDAEGADSADLASHDTPARPSPRRRGAA